MITGEYHISLDDKGRVMLPTRVRSGFSTSTVVLTQGVERCLWIFEPAEWSQICDNLMESTNMFQARARLIQRRIIAPAQETELDKSGRINISPALREYAQLRKECVVLGVGGYLEIWDEQKYRSYWEENEPEFQQAAEELGKLLSP
ncbi:MAG: division/cell wall cluster transcriptional repressor MraZ [Spirochaetales bacterium]|nr:division/cell wall cluster transcriptional repressor MraZ [Spirochaetales bacterium]